MKKSSARFSSLLKKHKNFLVSGHVNPDGDVIGSTLAMVLGLRKLGKKAIAFNNDGCPKSFRFLPKSDLIVSEVPPKFEGVLITVDSGDLSRLGNKIAGHQFEEIWNVDHHQSNTRFGDHNFIDLKAGSSGQVVLGLLETCRGFKLTKDIANNVFCTLSTDTGSFRYSNATPEVFALASKLVAAGAQPGKLSEALETYSAKRLELMKRVLQSLKFQRNGRQATLWLTQEDLMATGALAEDAESFVNLPRGVEGVRVVAFIRESTPTEWKVSLRSRGGVEVLPVARAFGGGGHKLAAGCTIQGTREQVEVKLNKIFEEKKYFE